MNSTALLYAIAKSLRYPSSKGCVAVLEKLTRLFRGVVEMKESGIPLLGIILRSLRIKVVWDFSTSIWSSFVS